MRLSTFLLTVAAASTVSAATFKCDKDSAVDYAKVITQYLDEKTVKEFDTAISLQVWNAVDELDGKKNGIKKQSSLECTIGTEACMSYKNDLLFCATTGENENFGNYKDNYGRKINFQTKDFELADGQKGNLDDLGNDKDFAAKLEKLVNKDGSLKSDGVVMRRSVMRAVVGVVIAVAALL